MNTVHKLLWDRSVADAALALWPALPGLWTGWDRATVLARAQDQLGRGVLSWPDAVAQDRRVALSVHGAALATHIAAHLAQRPPGAGPLRLLLNGAQGSGKSTLAQLLEDQLTVLGIPSACLALDDFYLPKAERARLGAEVHPLLRTRGVPGTHDVLALQTAVQALGQSGPPLALPTFDKAADDRRSAPRWLTRPRACLLLEGWCVGAPSAPPGESPAPLNALEAEEDRDGRWRAGVEAALAQHYAPLFAQFSDLIMLKVPSFESVYRFREAQEAALRAHRAQAMGPEAVRRFIAHYERLTRRQLAQLPAQAALCLTLDEDHALTAVSGPGIQG